MTLSALALVLTAALIHASWNLLAKRVSGATNGAAFVWLYGALSALLYTPPALWILLGPHAPLGAREIGVMTGSAIIHLAYFLVLQRGYRVGDLSVVYPLARGTGPLLSALAAVIVFSERPTLLAVCGAILVAGSVFLFARSASAKHSAVGETIAADGDVIARHRRRRAATSFGIGTGVLIALYTVWDKYAVATLGISPWLMEWSTSLARVVLLAPVAMAHWPDVRSLWSRYRAEAIGVGLLNPLSYVLVMIAMQTTPVTYLAPTREVSILIGAIMGARLLKEGDVRRRLVAAGCMVLGVVALAVG